MDVIYAISYELVVDNSIDFSSPEIDKSGLTATTYTSDISLADGTYFWHVRARDKYGNLSRWSDVQSFAIYLHETGTVTDIDGNLYLTVKIGNQWWMAENLRVTHYRNGNAIQKITEDNKWWSTNIGAYCIYDNNDGNTTKYGNLYNWYAVNDSRNIAPEGWHVPTDEDWKKLEMHLGMSKAEADWHSWRGTDEGSKLAGNKMLDDWTTFIFWYNTSEELGNNSEFGKSGFCALPGGCRSGHSGQFFDSGYGAKFWSSTRCYDLFGPTDRAYYRSLHYYHSQVERYSDFFEDGASVRLVRD
ncbi:fibrobacter succinogenes major paralogous domain-containing protein [candidate division KSB1 bacterium]|nr:fibrobacter succinogenes major paralogous domain-containing protein [candidate division KSB1 bacterium]